MKQFRPQLGFTLIELMAVVLIIAILATMGLVSYSQANKSARDAKRKSDMETVKQALVLYRQEEGTYFVSTSFTAMIGELATKNYLPSDASVSIVDPGSNTYTYSSAGTTFYARAQLENTSRGNSTSNTCGNNTAGQYYCVRNP